MEGRAVGSRSTWSASPTVYSPSTGTSCKTKQPGKSRKAACQCSARRFLRRQFRFYERCGECHMIHELRVFHCVPGRLPALLKRFENDTLRLFEKHGIKQLGFWTVAIGESNNDLFLILQWESLAERELKFGAFLQDPEWLEGRRKREEDGPVEASISNTILVPPAFSVFP